MKDPINCPICEAELRGHSRPWGLSPEGWIEVQKRHNMYHKDTHTKKDNR